MKKFHLILDLCSDLSFSEYTIYLQKCLFYLKMEDIRNKVSFFQLKDSLQYVYVSSTKNISLRADKYFCNSHR